MPAHTPGPWKADGTWILDEDGSLIAQVDGVRVEANARLLATAPALLEAAMMMITEVEADVVGEYSSPAILALRAAIAQAKGETV